MATATPQFLYHYTSLENLALILKNRTIAFNSLLNVDDIEEAETADMENLGKYVYVSCWTDVETESIAMWNMYTPNMQGVRIKLPVFPFKKYHYDVGQYHFSTACDSYIDIERLYRNNNCTIVANMPELCPITYTRNHDLVVPKARTGSKEDIEHFLSQKRIGEYQKGINAGYSFSLLGKFKREDWSFQREWRYWFFMLPVGAKDLFESSDPEQLFNTQKIIVQRLEDRDYPAPYRLFFFDLNDEAVKQMEIVLGPRISEGGRILAHALLKEHGLEHNCKDSSLRIR